MKYSLIKTKYSLFIIFNDESIPDLKKEFTSEKELDNFLLPLLYENKIQYYNVKFIEET